MKRKPLFLLFLIATMLILPSSGQCQSMDDLIDIGSVDLNSSYESFRALDSLFEGKSIVLLGEQSHREGTACRTKYQLIKYLHEVHDFDLLLFESDFYGGMKAWEEITAGAQMGETLAKSVFFVWSATVGFQQFSGYLADQLKTEDTLQVLGFDNQLSSQYFKESFEDVKAFIEMSEIISKEQKSHLIETIDLFQSGNSKALKKNGIDKDLSTIDSLLPATELLSFEEQSLLCLKSVLSDRFGKTYLRDQQMADNFNWIRKKHPNKKIICFGATSHFLYNSEEVQLKGPLYALADNFYAKNEMMGDYLKDQYGDELYSVGFTAVQGSIGGWFGKAKELKQPIEKSLEYQILRDYTESNFFFNLDPNSEFPFFSRPVGNAFMKTPANRVMDALVINYTMEPLKKDKDMFCKTFTSNIWICPENKERIENGG